MKKAAFYLLSLGLSLLVWISTGCGGGAKQVQGTYKVTGSAGITVNIAYALNGLDGNSQATSQTLPWQTNFTGYETEGNYQGSYVFLSAVNDLPNSGSNVNSSVTITILEDNTIFQAPDYATGGGNAVTLFGYF